MSIKQNGGVFGRNPTFNDVTIEGELTFDGDIDINSDLKVDGDLEVTGDAAIGTGFTPDTQLHVYSAADLVAKFESADQFADIALKDTGGTCYIRQSNGSLTFEADRAGASGNSRIFFKLDNQLAAHFTSGGNLAFESGKGIDFSATSGTGTSELFDDYEEGEWTPVVADASSGGNTGGGTLKGYYTKIGRTVFLVFSGSNITTSGMTSGNDLFITGLPYTPATVAGTNYYTGALVMHSVTTTGSVAAAIQDATNYINLYEIVSGTAFDFITVGDISTGVSDIRFSLTYEAA